MSRRAENFATFEINLLLKLIEKYKDAIECKKVDRFSLAEKENAWVKIAEEFNMRGSVERSLKTLKDKHKNLKKRKSQAEKVRPYSNGRETDCETVEGTTKDYKVYGPRHSVERNVEFIEIRTKAEPVDSDSLHNFEPDMLNTQDKPMLHHSADSDDDSMSWSKLATFKAKWFEHKMKKEIEIMEAEHHMRMRLMRDKNEMENRENELRQKQMKEKHEAEMQLLKDNTIVEKMVRKKRIHWTPAAEEILLNLWERDIEDLRSNKKNSLIYREMAAELNRRGFGFTKAEVNMKIHNFNNKFREEKKKMKSSGGLPSTWPYFDKVNSIIGGGQNITEDLMEDTID